MQDFPWKTWSSLSVNHTLYKTFDRGHVVRTSMAVSPRKNEKFTEHTCNTLVLDNESQSMLKA